MNNNNYLLVNSTVGALNRILKCSTILIGAFLFSGCEHTLDKTMTSDEVKNSSNYGYLVFELPDEKTGTFLPSEYRVGREKAISFFYFDHGYFAKHESISVTAILQAKSYIFYIPSRGDKTLVGATLYLGKGEYNDENIEYSMNIHFHQLKPIEGTCDFVNGQSKAVYMYGLPAEKSATITPFIHAGANITCFVADNYQR